MKHAEIIVLCSLTFGLFLISAITPKASDEVAGSYGSSDTELILHMDQTFQFTHPCDGVDATGTWILDGKKVKLNTDADIPSNWKVDPDYPCVRSELHGLEILRLCKKR